MGNTLFKPLAVAKEGHLCSWTTVFLTSVLSPLTSWDSTTVYEEASIVSLFGENETQG